MIKKFMITFVSAAVVMSAFLLVQGIAKGDLTNVVLGLVLLMLNGKNLRDLLKH